MTGAPLGWAQLTGRLLWSTSWKPRHAVVTASLAHTRTLNLVGLQNLEGLVGVTVTGGVRGISGGRRIPEADDT